MGQLAHIQRELARKKTDPGKQLASAFATLEGLVTALQKPAVSPEQHDQSMKTLMRGMSNLGKSLENARKTLEGAINLRPTDFIDIVESIDTLKGQVESFVSAVNGIKIPQPVVNIPEPKPVDFKPVIDEFHNGINALRQDMGMISFDVPQQSFQVEERPKEWSFDVKRKRNGYDITAKAT